MLTRSRLLSRCALTASRSFSSQCIAEELSDSKSTAASGCPPYFAHWAAGAFGLFLAAPSGGNYSQCGGTFKCARCGLDKDRAGASGCVKETNAKCEKNIAAAFREPCNYRAHVQCLVHANHVNENKKQIHTHRPHQNKTPTKQEYTKDTAHTPNNLQAIRCKKQDCTATRSEPAQSYIYIYIYMVRAAPGIWIIRLLPRNNLKNLKNSKNSKNSKKLK